MELRQLEYFAAVAEELHFTRAAERLGISQPTLSQQIRLLEHRLGAPLFHRIGKRTYLSEAGDILLQHARQTFHELEQAKTAIDELRGMKRGKLRIGCSGNHLLTGPIREFHGLHPDVQLSASELATEETRELLLSNRLDLGIVFLPLEDDLLESVPLFQEALVLAVSDGHELANETAVPLERLRDVPVMMLQEKFFVRQLFDDMCASAGFRIQPAMELSTIGSLAHMAEASASGGAVIPRSYADTLRIGGLRLVPIVDPEPSCAIGAVYRKGTHWSAAMSAFMRILIRHLQR